MSHILIDDRRPQLPHTNVFRHMQPDGLPPLSTTAATPMAFCTAREIETARKAARAS